MEQPNLAMIPSGVKAGKLYSIMPENGVGDFSATRNSTATRVNKDGLIETVALYTPRLNYDLINGKPDSCPHYLLEPQITNLVTYSEDLSQSFYSKINLSVSADNLQAPDGSLSAYKIVESTATAKHQLLASIGSYTTMTISFFAKKAERSFITIEKSGWGSTVFNIDLGSVASGTGSVQDFGNGWFRCIASYVASPAQSQFYIIINKDASTVNYEGDGVSGLYLWGLQAEALSYATSYIPTSGTTVTRAADTATGAGDASTFNSEQGILFAEIAALADDSTLRDISISDSSTSDRIMISFLNASNKIALQVISGGTQTGYAQYLGGTITNFNKIAVKYKANDFALWVNGAERTTDTSGVTPTGLLELAFHRGDSGAIFYGKCKDLRYYDTEGMTDTEIDNLLTQLTQ